MQRPPLGEGFERARYPCLVIAGGMLANQTVAALVGIIVPLVLDRFGIDPAVASSIFVTAMTDATGFFAFLALATWLLT